MAVGPRVEQTALVGARSALGPSLARMLREFQVELLEAAPMHLRAVVDAQLGRVGAMLDACRLVIWRADADRGAVTAEFEWYRASLDSLRNTTIELDQFPLPSGTLASGGPTVVLDDSSTAFFGAHEVLVVPLAARGRLLRFLTVAWADPRRPAPLSVEHGLLDGLYSLTAVVHGAAETNQLAERASYDEQTGLANRRLLLFMLNHLLSRLGRRAGGGVGVIFCELAELAVAEDVLVRLAKAFQQATRATDVVGRFDDRVLAVLCDDLRDPNEAIEVARRLVTICREVSPELSACIGVGYSDEAVAPGVLLRRADLATYQARLEGAGTIRTVSE